MGIGTSLGAHYADEKTWAASPYLKDPNSTPDKMEVSPNEIMPETIDPKQYETPLNSDEEVKFQDWKSKNAPSDSGEDYDLRGAFKAGVQPAENGHWPDTFKKPNHPTFSDQSKYAIDRPDLAGTWNGDVYISPKATEINAQMPFPDNNDPRTDFNYRYPKELPPAGILNDLKKPVEKPLQRRVDSGEVDVAMNLNNTPDEIISGLEGVRAWQNRGTSGPTQMRRSANDNTELYNKQDKNMIGNKAVDNEILQQWQAMAYRHERGNEIINQQKVLMEIAKQRPWSDLERFKFKQLDKEHDLLFRPD